MHRCTSSQIAEFGYDPKSQDFDVRFHDGARWRYSRVPLDVFMAFLHSESKGRFLNSRVKGLYEAERIL